MQVIPEQTRQPLLLETAIFARGGEANLYVVADSPTPVIAKIYHRPTPEKAAKLGAMIACPPIDPMAAKGHPSIAWPSDRLFAATPPHICVGYLMPRVDEVRPVFEFYNPKTRRQQCPLFQYRYLIRTARNLASAVNALHARGYVVGDLNESNILVTETALITLVDTDSFQVRDATRTYRCPVGKQEYTPPELQGVRFLDVDRSPEHDAFALAVMIFLLLMEGTHPYSGRYTGMGDPAPIATRIKAGWYPYSTTRSGLYEPMPSAPPLGLLHPEVRNLMRQCFEDGHQTPSARPDAAAWQKVLDAAETQLATCRTNAQHVYRVGFTACPWCERARRLGGWDPFPSREIVRKGTHLSPGAK
jgi:DNA-binding helix-hairpin-helix protein with protein kinase domain